MSCISTARTLAVLAMGICFSTLNVSATGNNTSIALTQANRYLHENPSKALSQAKLAIHEAKQSKDTTSLIVGYSLLCRISIIQDDVNLGKQYLDSAKRISTRITPEAIRAEVDLHTKLNNRKAIEELIGKSIKMANELADYALHVRLLLINSDVLRQDKDFMLAQSQAQKALELALANNLTDQVAVSQRTLGSIYLQKGEHANALEHYTSAETLFKELNDTKNLLITQRNISLAYRNKGEYNTSLSKLNAALNIALQQNNPDELGHIYNLIGSTYARMGMPTEALENYNHSLRYREENQLLASYASTLENISRIQRDLGQFTDALHNLNLTISISKELNDAQRLASTYNEMGNLYAQQGQHADALKYYLSSLKIRQEAELHSEVSRSLINIGITYRQLNSHHNALKYFSQALEIIADDSDPIGKSWVYIHLGNTYRDIENLKQAIANYSKALELRKKSGNQPLIAQSIRSLAVAYGENNEFDKAHQLFSQALTIATEQNDERAIADLYNELGNLSLREGNLQKAITFFEDASELYGKHFDLERRGLCVRKIGEIHTTLGNSTEAIENLQLALSLANLTKNAKLRELTLLALYEYHTAKEQYKEALSYFVKHIEIRDSLNAISEQEAIWQASLDLELNKKAEEIRAIEGEVENLRAEAQLKSIQLEQQRLIRNFLTITSLFVLVIAIGSILGYVIIRKKNSRLNIANEKLARSEKELTRTVQTKDKLFSIIAHDLRSPFTALVGLTSVLANQSSDMSSDEVKEYGSLIHESSQRLLSLIENLLFWSRSQTGKLKLIPKEFKLHALVADVFSVLSLQAKAKEINIENNVDPSTSLFADYETTATVIRNIVSNAIKFTNPHGHISIDAAKKNGMVEIRVTDNGIGISSENLSKLFRIEQSFSTKGTGEEVGTGLGLVVCKEFVEKNNGEIDVISKLGHGTSFIIRLPLP
ncbi:MAG: tetratricopeptide repeat protein [Tenuifilaceae bacterium]|nr:tetratricopeptide repeat protein [Tenuifilaceae bacterium]